MNCIIVDDEELAHNIIVEYISRIPFLKLVANCYNVQEAMEQLRGQQVDLIFLDINLPKISGIEFLRSSPRLPQVIITTAYDNCAVTGFEMDVIDYLLKPFSFERFLKAVYKSYGLQQQKELQKSVSENSLKENFIFVRSNNEDVKLKLREIIRINALKDYIIIHTPDRKLIVHQTMKSISEKLQYDNFIRVHNSHIISLQHLQSVGKNSVTIAGERIPVSEKYRPLLSAIIDQYK
ncbi:LytTR family DNA-binding domain-containing protein [Weeksellaceae bacterium A-14]